MSQQFFIGVDGGATKCMVHLEDETGRLIDCETGGPANIRLSAADTWDSINHCLFNILQRHSLSFSQKNLSFHAGMGLAGCEIPEALQAFLGQPHPFQTLTIRSDAHIACLGAHNGQDGAIVIIGTGTVGYQIQAGQTAKIGGWGFPHDDEGGGAWLGLEAVKLTLQWLDGRSAGSALASAVYQHFANDQKALVVWANQANSTAFATLAPLVVQCAQSGDAFARQLMQRAAAALDRIGDALAAAQPNPDQPLPCTLIGGLAPFLEPYLGKGLHARLRPLLTTPAAGAILLARQHLKESI